MTVKTQKTVKILAQYIWGGLAPQAPDTRRLWSCCSCWYV